MALGANEVSLLELAAAYTVFPNLGEVVRPALIRAVAAGDRVLYQDRMRRMRAATAPAAFVASHLLEGVVVRGTAAAARRLGLLGPVAGKTGTTNDEKDAWFVGYSPDWVAAVWVGFDDGTPVGLTGAAAALPIWVDLMKFLLGAYGERPFDVPPGVVFREVDRWSGLLTAFGCGETIREAFVAGTEPDETCDGRRVAPWEATGGQLEPSVEAEGPAGEVPERPGAASPWRGLSEILRDWLGGRR
jgi:penicillin-binding protein 1B